MLISKKLCKRKRDDHPEREEERMSFLSSGQKIDLEFRVCVCVYVCASVCIGGSTVEI